MLLSSYKESGKSVFIDNLVFMPFASRQEVEYCLKSDFLSSSLGIFTFSGIIQDIEHLNR